MQLLYKRQTLIKSISLMGAMAAINIVFSFLTNFVPFLAVLLIIFLPLTSAVVEVCCKDRYFPIYALATIGLSIVVTLSSFDFTLFYVVPSIVTGYVFGLVSKKNLPNFLAIFIASVIQTGLSFAFIPLIKLITERDLIQDIARIFNISDRTYFDNLLILIFFLVALVQTILSFIVVHNELEKMGQKSDKGKSYELITDCASIVSCVAMIGFAFVYLPIAYICLGFAWYFAVFSIYYAIINKQKWLAISMGASFLITLFLYAAFNTKLQKGYELLLLGITPTLISLLSISFYFLKKQKTEIK